MLTPQGQASLCGHYEVTLLLLEAGALCERGELFSHFFLIHIAF